MEEAFSIALGRVAKERGVAITKLASNGTSLLRDEQNATIINTDMDRVCIKFSRSEDISSTADSVARSVKERFVKFGTDCAFWYISTYLVTGESKGGADMGSNVQHILVLWY